MFLLAIMIGGPAEAVTLFPEFQRRALAGDDPIAAVRAILKNSASTGMGHLKTMLDRVLTEVAIPDDRRLFLEWLPRVSRFSFDLVLSRYWHF